MESLSPITIGAIGTIVKSNTHIDYVCQIYNQGESERTPQPSDYAFGAFVAIDLAEHGRLIGVIYNTLLLNPDFGSLGPRLSPRQELEIFSPDYLAETATLVGIIALGWQNEAGFYFQGVPALAATVNNKVQQLSEEDQRLFHSDGAGRPLLRYAPLLLAQNNPLAPQLLLAIIDHLAQLFPAYQRQLSVMRNNLAWKNIVEPVR
jgi:hypothetical protein